MNLLRKPPAYLPLAIKDNKEILEFLQAELKGSVDFFWQHTNLNHDSPGFGLVVDSTKELHMCSIAAVGFALTAWVIAAERGYLNCQKAQEIVLGTLRTLLFHASHFHGFFAHFLDMGTGTRIRNCEYSTIDTALCLNGVITAATYFRDAQITDLAEQLLERVDWNFFVFEREGQTLFHMAYQPRLNVANANGWHGLDSQWDMAAEQKVMYLQASGRVPPEIARKLYHGFSRDLGYYEGQPIIVNPRGNLFAYLFTEAWLDTRNYLDPDGVDWFNNTRLAALANRAFCMEHAREFKTYHANSWGSSCGDSPWGYDVSGSTPSLEKPQPNGTVSIYSAISCLPFIPDETLEMMLYLRTHHPQTWGPNGFYDAYNLDVDPVWYSHDLYGIDKGCSMIMIENYLSRLVWEVYTNSSVIQKALSILEFQKKEELIAGIND